MANHVSRPRPFFISQRLMVTIRNLAGQVLHEYPGDSLANVFLANLYLRNAQLAGHDLKGTDLRDSNLCDANLEGADLTAALLDDVDLSRANLRNAKLDQASCYRTNLARADLTGVQARRVQFLEATLEHAIAPGADFTGSEFRQCNGQNIQADGAVFRNCRFEDCDLSRASFMKGDFCGAQMARVNLEYACLADAVVRDAMLRSVQLYAALVSDVDFHGSELIGCRGRDAHGQLGVWPPLAFESTVLGPIFGPSTNWSDDVEFPRRRFDWRMPAWIGGISGGLAWLVALGLRLDSSALAKVGAAAMTAMLIASLVQVISIWKTNPRIAAEPHVWFDGALAERRLRRRGEP